MNQNRRPNRPVPPDNYTAVDLQVLRLLAEPAKMQAEQYMVNELKRQLEAADFHGDAITVAPARLKNSLDDLLPLALRLADDGSAYPPHVKFAFWLGGLSALIGAALLLAII